MSFLARPASINSWLHMFSEAAYAANRKRAYNPGPGGIKIGGFSNGNLVLARGLQRLVSLGWNINVSSVELYNPNITHSVLKSILRNTGSAPVSIYLGLKDPFEGTYVLSPDQVKSIALAPLGQGRVSVFMVLAGHDFNSMVQHRSSAVEIIHNGALTDRGAAYFRSGRQFSSLEMQK
jgi:hypothetical protein